MDENMGNAEYNQLILLETAGIITRIPHVTLDYFYVMSKFVINGL
jgi:hypothetical protein